MENLSVIYDTTLSGLWIQQGRLVSSGGLDKFLKGSQTPCLASYGLSTTLNTYGVGEWYAFSVRSLEAYIESF